MAGTMGLNKILGDLEGYLRLAVEEKYPPEEVSREVIRGLAKASFGNSVKLAMPVPPSAVNANVPPAVRGVSSGHPGLLEIAETVAACRKCSLYATRTRVVPGQGSSSPEIMFVGEAPGADEDLQGLAFVGAAGKLLTKMIEAMGYTRDQVFIGNILKCRPPGNRNPEPDEIAACEKFLFRQIDSVQPKVICALGAFSAKTLLRTNEPISRLRGHLVDYRGAKLMATFHPAYLLRNPIEKRKVWEDVQVIREPVGIRLPGYLLLSIP